MGLAFGVESRRRVAISIARVGDAVSNVSTEFSFDKFSVLFDGGDEDFLRVNNSFTCCWLLSVFNKSGETKNLILISKPLINQSLNKKKPMINCLANNKFESVIQSV